MTSAGRILSNANETTAPLMFPIQENNSTIIWKNVPCPLLEHRIFHNHRQAVSKPHFTKNANLHENHCKVQIAMYDTFGKTTSLKKSVNAIALATETKPEGPDQSLEEKWLNRHKIVSIQKRTKSWCHY